MRARSRVISEKLDQEAQTGFRSNRGTCGGTWNVGMAIAKRKEHGAESWVLLLDLVKAFDRVPRELLWEVMKRFGYPPKFMRILIKLHTGVKVNFSMHGVEKEVSSTIGVAASASNSMGSASSNLTDRDDHIKPEWSIRISYTPLEWLAENPNRIPVLALGSRPLCLGSHTYALHPNDRMWSELHSLSYHTSLGAVCVALPLVGI
jgi:hypothetical protein